ncbi:MAG: hypothetical protein KIH69_023720 [Anaerolineae bacterium]|nr:hypothetical protein [Anaerolineae bacterium]
MAAGFAFLLAELVILNHTSGPRMIGAIACVAGIVLSLAALAPNSRLRQILAILFVLVALSGLFGANTHQGSRGFRQQGVASAPATEDRTIRRALNSFGNLPPTLAPLALSGLAMLGAAVTLAGSAKRD